jgi:hypothetical protein
VVQEFLRRVGTPHLHNGGPLDKSLVVDIYSCLHSEAHDMRIFYILNWGAKYMIESNKRLLNLFSPPSFENQKNSNTIEKYTSDKSLIGYEIRILGGEYMPTYYVKNINFD